MGCAARIALNRQGGRNAAVQATGALAANIPAPGELRAPDDARDEMKGVPLHGYVKE